MIGHVHACKGMTKDEFEDHFSQFIINSWSYSKVNSFARNEKAFEMNYIYRNPFKNSASSVAGNAYHEALRNFFTAKQESTPLPDLVELQYVAFEYIDAVEPKDWKIQKTTPTVEQCIVKSTKISTVILENFMAELSLYTENMGEIMGIEMKLREFVAVNGVDVPLPCHAIIDLVFKTLDGKVVILDHKSKASFTDEKALKFTMGKQAMTYVLAYESYTGIQVDEVWFVENKTSKNRDGSPQLNCFKVVLDDNTRRLYEAMLYEPLKKMIEAVSDPDYTYMINDADSFTDTAEMYEFWTRTMIAEVEDFDIPEDKKDMIQKRLKKIRDVTIATVDPKTIKKFQEHAAEFIQYDLSNKNMTNQQKIQHVLRAFSILVKIPYKFDGYSSDTFLLEVSAGTSIATIHRHRLDIASALSVPSVRIMKNLYVHEGKSYVAIEAAKTREKDLIYHESYLEDMKIPIGIDNFGNTIVWDLDNQSTPHALVCGATGSGKSVCVESVINYALLAGVKDIIIFDPKHEFRTADFATHRYVKIYSDIEIIEVVMAELVEDMNDRIKRNRSHKTLVIFDEFATAFANSKKGKSLEIRELREVGTYKDGSPKMKEHVVSVLKSLEENLTLLLQLGRSSGFRVMAATQRASAKVITGDAKVNLPVLICFRVNKAIDSKVVLDEDGAENLSGKGDGLMNSPEYMGLVRFQSFYKPS